MAKTLAEVRFDATRVRGGAAIVFKVRVHRPERQPGAAWTCGHEVYVGRKRIAAVWLFGDTPRQVLARTVAFLRTDLPKRAWRHRVSVTDWRSDELARIAKARAAPKAR